jgi:hypothetical protein
MEKKANTKTEETEDINPKNPKRLRTLCIDEVIPCEYEVENNDMDVQQLGFVTKTQIQTLTNDEQLKKISGDHYVLYYLVFLDPKQGMIYGARYGIKNVSCCETIVFQKT